jgi:hypothetical protein
MERFPVTPFEELSWDRKQEFRIGLTNGGLRRASPALYPESVLTALKVGEVMIWMRESGVVWIARILRPEERLPHADLEGVRVFIRSRKGYEEIYG